MVVDRQYFPPCLERILDRHESPLLRESLICRVHGASDFLAAGNRVDGKFDAA